MVRVSLPPHIHKIALGWHGGHGSQMARLADFEDFDPAGVIREIEIRREELHKTKIEIEIKDTFFQELGKLKRYIMNLVQAEKDKEND